ncbi:MAG: hypothetical protein WAO83_03965 [Fuerstiella sp.]
MTGTRSLSYWLSLALMLSVTSSASCAEIVQYLGYSQAVQLKNENTTVVLCPEVGGRVLEYSLNGKNVLFISDSEKNWKPGDRPESSAGRFDIGPELVIPRRDVSWSGAWSTEIIGDLHVRLTSQKDEATGVQLVRDFELDAKTPKLLCTQTIVNVSSELKEWCHWSRTFAVGKGVCVIPLTEAGISPISRFPNKYVLYEEGGLINMKPEDPQVRRHNNTLQIFPTPRKPKLGFDSYAGIIGYAAPNDLFFLKRFKTHPNRIYNEAAGLTISVWYPDNQMIELEPIGPRETLKPGESASFTEEWWLAPLEFPGTEKVLDSTTLDRLMDSLK